MATMNAEPPVLNRKEFYKRTLPAVAALLPAYELETGEMFLSLAMVYDTISSHFNKRLGRYGLSFPAFNLMMILHSPSYRDTGCPMSRLGELLLVSKANVTGLADSLQRKGLVRRVEAENDRRIKLLQLTPEGTSLSGKLLPAHLAEVVRVLQGVSRRERATLRDLLRKLQATVDTAIEETHE